MPSSVQKVSAYSSAGSVPACPPVFPFFGSEGKYFFTGCRGLQSWREVALLGAAVL